MPPKSIIRFVAGQRFNRLVTVADLPGTGDPKHRRRWRCRCDCGNERAFSPWRVVAGKTKSCGCLNREAVSKACRTHGLSASHPDYKLWAAMRARCEKPGSEAYHNYGGRGIKVCPRWIDFAAFIADMGPRPSPRHTLDRLDNDGDYEPENCRWATSNQQTRNKRVNRWITFQGRSMVIADWARELRINANVLGHRLKQGWPLEKVLSPLRYTHTGRPVKGQDYT